MKWLCVRSGGAVRLTSEIPLLTWSNSILLKLFIIAQCSDTKYFPSESEGFT